MAHCEVISKLLEWVWGGASLSAIGSVDVNATAFISFSNPNIVQQYSTYDTSTIHCYYPSLLSPLDATLIHESGYCSHKPDVSTLGSAHHPKAVRIRVLPWCRGWLGSLIGSVWVSGHGGWSAEDAGWEGRGV